MRFFGSTRSRPGWLCINLLPDRVDLSHVLAEGRSRPEVLLCDSYHKESDDVATLKRLRRELNLDRYRCTTLLRTGDYQMVQVDAPGVPAPGCTTRPAGLSTTMRSSSSWTTCDGTTSPSPAIPSSKPPTSISWRTKARGS